MIYTCYDMLRDCRAGRPEGWSYFVSSYIPVIRRILEHYAPGTDSLEHVILALREEQATLFASAEPAPERWFVAELRQQVLAAIETGEPSPAPDSNVDLEVLSTALESLTLVEKQALWLETMRYNPEDSGRLLRMDPRTVAKIRDKAAELLRGNMDAWSRDLLVENGRELGRAATACGTPECLPAKAFLDVLDGRTTWRGREEMERHVIPCWHCIDHFCRMAEVVELVRGVQPLSESETEPFRKLLGLAPQKRAFWKKVFR